MSERLEHELAQLGGMTVNVIRPGFGTQSDSYMGTLTVFNSDEYPLKFQLQSAGVSILFTVEDVMEVEQRFMLPTSLIRLKGPQDYSQRANTVHA